MRPKPEHTKSSRWWIWLILLLAAGAATYRWYPLVTQATSKAEPKKSGKGDAGRAVPVIAAMARKGDMPVYLDGLGSVTAFNTVTVQTRVDGQIIKSAFTEGQFVKQGDLLIEIDPRPFQVQLEQAEAQTGAGHQAQLGERESRPGTLQGSVSRRRRCRSSSWTRRRRGEPDRCDHQSRSGADR